MTAFVPLQSARATLAATGTITFPGPRHATLAGAGLLRAETSRIVNGVRLRDGFIKIIDSGTLAATPRRRRSTSISFGGTSSVRVGEGVKTRLALRLTSLGGDGYAQSRGTLPLFVTFATDSRINPAIPSTEGTPSELGLSLSGMASDREYNSASVMLVPLFGLAADDGDGAARMSSVVMAYTDIVATQELAVAMREKWSMSQTLFMSALVEAKMQEHWKLTDVLAAASTYDLTMKEALTVVDGFLRDTRDQAWVVNLNAQDRYGKKIYPNTMYDRFAFTSMARFQNRYFGVRTDGIYELVGDTDAGEPIKAMILTGKDDYGSPQVKQMQYVYADVHAASDLAVTVITDNPKAYTYVMAKTESMRNSRAVLGRGLRARHWQLKITNPDGGDFTLNSAEAFADASTRRLK